MKKSEPHSGPAPAPPGYQIEEYEAGSQTTTYIRTPEHTPDAEHLLHTHPALIRAAHLVITAVLWCAVSAVLLLLLLYAWRTVVVAAAIAWFFATVFLSAYDAVATPWGGDGPTPEPEPGWVGAVLEGKGWRSIYHDGEDVREDAAEIHEKQPRPEPLKRLADHEPEKPLGKGAELEINNNTQ